MNHNIHTPRVPNYIGVSITKRQEPQMVPVQDFTEDQLREIGKKWTEDLVAKARKQRHNRD